MEFTCSSDSGVRWSRDIAFLSPFHHSSSVSSFYYLSSFYYFDSDWEDFQDKFKREFCPIYADSAAINQLESTAYFQKSRSVDEYLNEFQDLITEARYSDLKTIVVKFRRGLDTQIQNAIATMPSGRPSNMVPTDWYTAARTIDQNRATNEAFWSSYRTPSVALTSFRPATFNTIQFQALEQSANHQHAPTHRNLFW